MHDVEILFEYSLFLFSVKKKINSNMILDMLENASPQLEGIVDIILFL
jgi:hypothetical protein